MFAVLDGEKILARFSDDEAADEYRHLVQTEPFPLYEGLRVAALCSTCHEHIEAEDGVCRDNDDKKENHDNKGT